MSSSRLAASKRALKNNQQRPAQRGRPKQDMRHEEVIERASMLFSTRGYAATTLEDIGAALGISRPGLYHYAESKEDLLDQCYVWSYARFLKMLEAELGEGTGRELLTKFFQIYSVIVCDDASRCFLASEDHFLGPERQKAAVKRARHINELAGDLLDLGIKDGSLAPCDRKNALTILFGTFNALPKLVRDQGARVEALASDFLELILRGLLPRGANEPS